MSGASDSSSGEKSLVFDFHSPVISRICLLLFFLATAAAIPFSDFGKAGSVFYFVPLMLLASLAGWRAVHGFQFVKPVSQPAVFWSVAIALRCLALLMSPGDDIYRYLWEGKIQWHGFNPYLLAPDSTLLAGLRDGIWQHINHRDWAAIYPPGAELILKLLTIAGPSIILIKMVCVLADLAVVGLLLKIITGPTRFSRAVFYAWNPLVIYSFAGAGHFDCLMLAPLMLAVYALIRARSLEMLPARWGWALLVAMMLGVSISIKLVPIVLVPVFALALRSRMVVLVVTAIIPSGLAMCYGFPQTPIFDAFRRFTYVTRFNDFIWWISERVFWSNPEQKNGIYNLIAAAAIIIICGITRHDWRKALLWVLGITIMFSTVVHPWYVVWILPFAAIRKAHAWFVLAGTIFLSFLWWESTAWWVAWKPSPLLSLSICLPPLLLAIYFGFTKRTGQPSAPR